MLRIGLAPCSPFRVTPELMRESARMARSLPRVGLHTHLAETLDENRYCVDEIRQAPARLCRVARAGWATRSGSRTWCIPTRRRSARLAHSHTGVCHCPSSNMILASGIAPVREMLDAGVKVALRR